MYIIISDVVHHKHTPCVERILLTLCYNLLAKDTYSKTLMTNGTYTSAVYNVKNVPKLFTYITLMTPQFSSTNTLLTNKPDFDNKDIAKKLLNT